MSRSGLAVDFTLFFFFKQKTAYEMRISDWSSDVCSSDLLNAQERAILADDVQDEIAGLGPLEPLLRDPEIDDVIVNGATRVYVERGGRLSLAPVRFRDDAHLMNVIHRLVSPIGRRVAEASPYFDAPRPHGPRATTASTPT